MQIKARLYTDLERTERRRVDSPATLRDSDNVAHAVVIENLSMTGFLIETRVEMAVGDTLAVGIPPLGLHQAEVVRVADSGYGCAFVQPISQSDVERAGEETLLWGAFSDTGEPLDAAEAQGLSGAARVAIIAAVATITWGLVIAAGWALFG